MDASLLKYPNKSHRKIIKFPNESNDLAELMGIIAGDGGINNNWQLVISLNSIKDLNYSSYIISLIEKLFNIKVAIRKRPNQNTLILVCSSTSLVDYLVSKGAIRGNKITQEINIPSWITKKIAFKKAYVRGIVDTDGCLYIHKHSVSRSQYSNIGFCFTSFSDKLLLSVAHILSEFGIEPHIKDKNHRIYLYSESNVVRYLNTFGSSNPRIYQKYADWKGARAVESTRLESVRNRKITGGSNPPPSANQPQN
jgi:DNA-binding transcriptional regulator WhiA